MEMTASNTIRISRTVILFFLLKTYTSPFRDLLNPQIIILDSPNIYLDLKNINNFLKIIRTIKRRYNKTIIIFSQDSNFVHGIADYLFIIDNNNIIAEGNKYIIFNNEELLKNNKIKIPNIIEFEKLILKSKNINLKRRDNINDLIKDICFYNWNKI